MEWKKGLAKQGEVEVATGSSDQEWGEKTGRYMSETGPGRGDTT